MLFTSSTLLRIWILHSIVDYKMNEIHRAHYLKNEVKYIQEKNDNPLQNIKILK